MGDASRICTGTFTKNNDTITLSSTYSENDFCNIKKINKENKSHDSITIYLKPTKQIYLRGPRLYINAGSKYIGNYSIGDTLKISKEVESVFIYSRCLYNMDWEIKIDVTRDITNYVFNLKKNINNESIFFSKVRFKIEKDKLIMIDNFYFLDIVNNEFER